MSKIERCAFSAKLTAVNIVTRFRCNGMSLSRSLSFSSRFHLDLLERHVSYDSRRDEKKIARNQPIDFATEINDGAAWLDTVEVLAHEFILVRGHNAYQSNQ